MENHLQNELERISKLPVSRQQIELAALISEKFKDRGIVSVVVGGAAVAFYSKEAYTTADVDIVLAGDTKKDIEEIMSSLGFTRTSTYRHFEHPLYSFVVEFPPSPVQVGGKIIEKVNEIDLGKRKVKIIRIEDIIMDRIIAGVEWRDKQSVAQAKLLWQTNKEQIDHKYLTKFAKNEGYQKKLKEIVG